ncbi:hypothetical protein FF098_010450 [Parvularcula flava]|uniref:Uncharacterized protein n=1 Tax=Aquisalinus luteolus TaxID=1566827 RepID=A0A8J3A2I6_9PROT|nr:hypothetical protein [Aquisalinus luteolus]NHK28325.1 hypothetical protein [Aquisalinus luteolus]GGH98135.1 hypothetical protein GCM10011355_21010 [Aquisalinus luteolus]
MRILLFSILLAAAGLEASYAQIGGSSPRADTEKGPAGEQLTSTPDKRIIYEVPEWYDPDDPCPVKPADGDPLKLRVSSDKSLVQLSDTITLDFSLEYDPYRSYVLSNEIRERTCRNDPDCTEYVQWIIPDRGAYVHGLDLEGEDRSIILYAVEILDREKVLLADRSRSIDTREIPFNDYDPANSTPDPLLDSVFRIRGLIPIEKAVYMAPGERISETVSIAVADLGIGPGEYEIGAIYINRLEELSDEQREKYLYNSAGERVADVHSGKCVFFDFVLSKAPAVELIVQ